MWSTIEQHIQGATEQPFSILHKEIAVGGDINLCFWVSNYQQKYFVKLNDKSHLTHFESEAYALEKIKSAHQINCPDVISVGTTLNKSFLVLSYIPFETPDSHDWYHLGQQLAQLHKNSSHGQFGWQHDNFIGDTLQPNKWQSNWRTFFAEQRIGWQLQLLHEKSIKLGNIDHITQVCHDALLHHQVTPCLVHGDLWQGNIGFTDHKPVIFDPACYYGDREVDIAMTELFGLLPDDFYQGYHVEFPLPPNYEQRKLVYNFYHILNHANLFGGIYIEQSKAVLSRILSIH
ncbi:fructosamine kinase family protein [Colwellia sp. 1_MG-2023]|uniref:fructosamine kinase family protein n=1 Tax=Colwellia sp. 1_MG-2023 TaxID=3062649 RepID=UPI0026E1E506|nr:fructosamine kinase family protein [Colwellia sp. 1_MG-2023]MDO6447221.1 fructosamine kinase family protein [Colwellia sp. 1_MG-2023]